MSFDFTGQYPSVDILARNSTWSSMGAVIKSDVKLQLLALLSKKLGSVSQRHLAKDFGVGKTTINRWSRELGFVVSKNTVDEFFFDKWNPYSAYLLGYIFADGNVSWNEEKSYWSLTITAAEKDVAHLERMRNILRSTKPLLYSKATRSYRLIATSKSLCRKLMALGAIPKKSLVVDFPVIPREFLADFIRGVVDGDGNVRYVDRSRSPYFEITISSGSIRFLEGLAFNVQTAFGISAKVRKAHGNTYVLQYSCSRGEAFANVLYRNAVIFLERKFAPYDSLQKKRRNEKMGERYFFTSESVTEGHPDKTM